MIHLAYLGQGRDYHVHKWLPAVAEQGVAVTLLSYAAPEIELPGVAFRQLKPPFASSVDTLTIRDFWGSSTPLRTILEEIEADILMASYATNYGWLGVRTGFHPLIAQAWTADIQIHPWKGWKGWIFRPMVRRFLREADLIVSDGEALAAEVERLFPAASGKTLPIRWGIRLGDYAFSEEKRSGLRSELGIPDDAPILTSARGLLHIFRPEMVMDVLERVIDARPAVHAVFLTLARDRSPAVENRLEQFGAVTNVHVFDRFLSREEMQSVWSATDVLISVPTHDGISEGILEGMYAGCIPVVSDIPSNRSFLEDGVSGLFVGAEPADADKIARTLIDAVDRLPQLKDDMVERNRRWVAERASIEGSASLLVSAVRRLVDKSLSE